MKLKRLTALIAAFCMMASLAAYADTTAVVTADTVTKQVVAFDNYESYVTSDAMPWNNGGGNNVTKASLETLDGNKCMKVSNVPVGTTNYRHESYRSIAEYDRTTMNKMIIGFSLYVESISTSVYATVKTSDNSGKLFNINSSRKLALGNNSSLDFVLDQYKWYDFIFEYCPSDGSIKANIKGENTDATYTGTADISTISDKFNRFTFIIDSKSTSNAVYIDNFFVYGTDKSTSSLYNGTYYDFEDFVPSDNGLTFPYGMEPDNTNNYIELYTETTETTGKCLEISTNAAKWPSLRITVNEDGISGKSVLEFDYKASSTCKTRFGIRGADSAGNSVNYTVPLIGFYGDGILKVNGPGDSTDVAETDELETRIVVDTWYHYVFEFDTDAYTWKVTITSPGKTTVTYSDDIPINPDKNPVYSIKYIDLFNNGVKSTDYIDNIYFKSADTLPAISGITPANYQINKKENKVRVAFNGDIASNIKDHQFKVNTQEVTPTVFGNTALLTLSNNMNVGDFYFVEASAVDSAGNPLYAATALRVVDEIIVSDFAYDSQAANGTVAADANVVSNSDDYTTATLITAVYDGNTLVAIDVNPVNLIRGVKTALESSVTLPAGYSNLKTVSYIWNSATGTIVPFADALPLE